MFAALTWSCLVYSNWRARVDRQRTYRIGFENSPRQYVDSQGRPYGPAIDMLNEAARRSGVRLEWVHRPGGPDRALAERSVDLWPVLNRIPERSYLHITEPLAETNYWLVSRAGEAVAGRTVGIGAGLVVYLVRKHLPRARIEMFDGIAEVRAGGL